MRLATWNVNSLNKRLPRVEEWLEIAAPDVLCLQETKLADDAFPQLTFEALGYEVAHHGQGQWNGVAILSKVGLTNVTSGFEDLVDPYEGDARLLTAECGGIRMISVYVPNGREVGSDFYERKLAWFGRLREWLAATYSPDVPLAIVGDFNVAPEDRDVWSPKAFVGVHARDRRPSAPPSPRSRSGASSTRSARSTTRTGCSRTGTTGAATSTSTAACASTSRSSPSPSPIG